MASSKKCRFPVQLPYILHLINPLKNKKTTWNCPVAPDIRKGISRLRPLVVSLRAVLRMKMSVERLWKIEVFGGKPVPVPIFQHKSNISQRTQCISIRKPSLNTVLGNNRCLFLESYGTHKCTLWAKLNVKPGGTDTLLPDVICMYHGINCCFVDLSRFSIILSQLLCTSNCSPSDENCFEDFVLPEPFRCVLQRMLFTVRTMCYPCFENFILYILEDHLWKKQTHAVLLCNIRVRPQSTKIKTGYGKQILTWYITWNCEVNCVIFFEQ